MSKLLKPAFVTLILTALLACGSTQEETRFTPASPIQPSVKMRVTDVSNKTTEVFDVDVIGNFWNALDATLHQRGLLWDGKPGVRPLQVQAEILEYQKGNYFLRNILPPWGKTTIKARCIVIDEGRVIASSETVQSITLGDGSFTTEAWRKIFMMAAEDLISQIVTKL